MRFLGILILLGTISRFAQADELTPSGSPRTSEPVALPTAAEGGPVNFDEAAKDLTAVYPIQLSDFSQVVQNSYNWKGPGDASMKCDIGFTRSAIIVKGDFKDDHPFYQPYVHPAMADWWKIRYGADGIEFIMDDPTSSARRVQFALNFSSAAVDPRVELIVSPFGKKTGFLKTAVLEVGAPGERDGGTYVAGNPIQFRAAIPFAEIADPKFFAGPLRITARLHDMDGDPSTYLMMEQVIETK